MKTQLDKQQSQHLIDLGVPKEKATGNCHIIIQSNYPIFTLTDLLEILPKEIENRFCINIDWNFLTETWGVEYNYMEVSFHSSEELIDALYELCVWCLEQGYLKL